MSSSPTQVAGNAAPRVTNEEVRAVLHTHIRKTAKFIKFLDLCVHLFTWVAAMFGLWLLACVVDHWLVPLSSVGRWLVWTVAVAGTTWWMVTKLVPLVFRRINPAYAAKRIEHLLPEFKNGLISWLELDQMPENGVPRGIMSALTYRAARFIGGQDPSNTVDTSRFIKLIGVVLLLFTSLVLYMIVSPKSALDTGKRIAMPWRSIATPSRVQILNVKPGAVELTQGKPLEVEVEVRGIRTKEPVQVRFTTTDGQLRDQRIELTAVTEGFRYSGKVRTETTGVEHELDYWVEAGDATSGPYRVSLSPLPSVVLDQVELKFPAYTKIPDRKVSGDFEAVEGSRATIRALGNQRMSRGRLEINPEVDAAGDLLRADAVHELSVDDRQLTGTLLLKLNSEKENPTNLTYRLRGFNQRGDGNREPILHSMKVIADVGPEINLVGPENRRLRVRPTKKFNLEVQANDPDFGLSQIDIEIRRSGLVVRKETLLKSDGAIGQQIKRLPIDMADFKLPEGTKLEVRATAYDNRHDPDSEKLAPNLKESELLTLEVVGPDQDVAPDEEPAPADESTVGKSEKNQEAGNEASRSGSGAGNQPNNQGGAGDRDAPNDPNGSTNDAEPSGDNANQNDGSQTPRQNSTPNPANPNGSRDQGKQAGAEGKEEGKQGKQKGGQGKQGDQSKSSDGKSSDGKQKSRQAGGEQSGDGKQDSQGANEQGGQSGDKSGDKSGTQPGSKFGGNESSDGSKQPDAGSGSSSKNSQANPSNSGKAGNEPSNSPSNSLGSKSSSPSPNAPKSNSAEKGSSGDNSNFADNGANETGANSGSGEGSKPSDGEAVKIVQDFMQKPKPSGNESGNKSDSNESGASESDGNSKSSDKAGTDSKNGNKQPGEKGATPKQNGSDKDEAQNTGAKDEGVKPTDPSGKGKSSEENSQTNDKGSQEKSSEDKGSNSKEASDSNGDKNSDSNSPGDKNSNGQNSEQKGSQGKGSENKGSENKGSEGKGSEGKGSEGKGSEGKGSEGKGSEGKGSDGKGSEGKGSQGKGSEGKGSEGKGSEGSDGKGSDGSDGKGAESKGGDSKGAESKGAESKGAESKGAESKGAESKGAESKGAESKGAESKGADSKGEQSGAQADQPSSGSEGGGKSNASKSGKSGTSGSGTGNGEGRDGKADAANEDYANRTTQMVLDYLNRQKDQPDPELLRELNWTEDDLRKFTERWNKARNLAVSPNPEDQKKWKEMLDDLGLNRQTIKPSAAGSIDDNFQQMRDSGNRTRPPENLRKQYEAFRRAFEKSGK